MDSLITVMNKLQDMFSTVTLTQNIDLPQIVVVGSQSSGKSSVLESLVGKSFLPRGTGIVTRAPLVLHLINSSEFEEETNDCKSYNDCATFQHKPNVVFYDFDKVRKEIELKTIELAGDNKNISNQPIVLNVYSKQLYNLSFVDLPGLTKMPVGDQPDDIEIQIRELVLEYINNANSIILAVVTANTDPATSESLHIAKSVDPSGDRTIAVVTKLDIMDAGTDANELLCGQVIPVKLGIIGVINRSQKDINEQKTIKQSLEAEEKYFRMKYPTIADKHGTIVLGKRLQHLLIAKIKETCPDLKNQILDMYNTYSKQLRKYKEFTNNYDRSLLDLITQIVTSYVASLDGQASNTSLTKLDGGAEISNYFKVVFNKEIDEIDPLKGLSNDAIMNVINNASGTSMGVFMPATAFDHIVKKQLRQLEEPSLKCVSFVHEKLMSNIFNLNNDTSSELKKYPRLMERIVDLLETLLNKYKEKSNDAVIKMILYQEAMINTHHPDFVEAVIESDDYKELFLPIKLNGKQMSENNSFSDSEEEAEFDSSMNNDFIKKEFLEESKRKAVERITTCAFSSFSKTDKTILESRAQLLTLFIQCYFKVVKKMVQDIIPKTIMYEMVNQIKQNFQKALISKVYKSNDLKMEDLLIESPEVIDERVKAQNRFDATDRALKLMREIEQLCHVSG
jgi:dynamin 1-like protein|uniref:Dynamin-1-like protein n=1 Tax=Sipha flava TaxID=143950 RepID=A0A2S2QA82_9HEMI